MYRFAWILAGLILPSIACSANNDNWARIIHNVTDSIITIRVDAVRAFDTSANSSSQATGFVVDAERGIVLTNRHVVQPGPVIAEALFANREEIELKPLYRDPVHDFGFFQYNPADLKFIKPESLPIRPDAAVVGKDIRVVGNDAGEQLSILAGTLARIDRQAPFYGYGRYNDFNTFYYQSASGVSGGSSGSPVLDAQGNVIALNAGGSTQAASSFFLPLQRVKRVLQLIQEDKPVSRGTLQTTFDYKPYDEARRLGLRAEVEAALRKINHGVGLLVVQRSLPESSASSILQPGDIIVKGGASKGALNWIRKYAELEALLDEHVGEVIHLLLERNGHATEVSIVVDDLHAITPDRYITFGQAIVHNLSYQQARHLNRPVKGVYVAQPGYLLSSAGVPGGSVILSINSQPTDSLAAFEKVLATLTDQQQAALEYITFDEPRRTHLSVMRMDRRWFPLRKCYRDDRQGIWPCENLAELDGSERVDTTHVKFIDYKDKRASRLSASIVSVQFDIPYQINGVDETHYAGTGLIINQKDGLVLVDRNTVPIVLGDVRIQFAGALDIPAKVLFVHPLHNLAIVQYDPALLGDTEVTEIKLADKLLAEGEKTWLVALKDAQQLLVEETRVSAIGPLSFSVPEVPVFRESNLEVISLHNPPPSLGGVLANSRGEVQAMWASFSYGSGRDLKQHEWGISAELIKDIIEQWNCCKHFRIRSLEVQLASLSIAQARKLGLSDQWTEVFQNTDKKRQVLAVSRIVTGSDAEIKLKEGDLILAIDDQPVRSYREVESLTQKDQVKVTMSRMGREIALMVNTAELNGNASRKIMQWAGALIQQPYRELSLQRGVKAEGVYVSFIYHGSPATRSGLSPMLRIVEVNGDKTSDLDEFKRLIRQYQQDKYVKVKLVDLLGRETLISVKQNNYYWPLAEISKQQGEWRNQQILSR